MNVHSSATRLRQSHESQLKHRHAVGPQQHSSPNGSRHQHRIRGAIITNDSHMIYVYIYEASHMHVNHCNPIHIGTSEVRSTRTDGCNQMACATVHVVAGWGDSRWEDVCTG